MKRSVFGLTLILLFAVIAVAYAQGPGWSGMGHGWGVGPGMMSGGMMGPGMMGCGQRMMGSGQEGWNYCPYCGQYIGPREGMTGSGMMGPRHRSLSEECQKFLNETAMLRKELHSKKFEYFEASRDPKSTPESTAKLEKEVRELQQKIYEKSPQGCWW